METKNSQTLKTLSQFIATGGFLGLSPWAPGTLGSLLALALWWWFPLNPWEISGLIVLSFLVAWGTIHIYEREKRHHDPKEVVIDEIIGQWIALCGLPLNPIMGLLSFSLFRILDICKPFPLGWIDRKIPGALGTLLDDVGAGLMTQLFIFWIYPLMERHVITF